MLKTYAVTYTWPHNTAKDRLQQETMVVQKETDILAKALCLENLHATGRMGRKVVQVSCIAARPGR